MQGECVYLGQKVADMKMDGEDVGVHLCSCPRVIPEVTIASEKMRGQPFEISAKLKRGERTLESKFANCCACPHKTDVTDDRPWRLDELRYVTTAELVRDALRLVPQLPRSIGGVAGIPRSGLLPALTIATALKLPAFALDPRQGLLHIGAGSRQLTLDDRPAGSLLVVDDTLYDGRAIARAREQLDGYDAIFCVVYSRLPDLADIHFRTLPSPHLCEWNIFQNPVMSGQAQDKRLRGGLAFDFDGVFCQNPSGPVTFDWLRNVPPLHYLPKACEIPLVVSMRLEAWRDESEAWLVRHGAKAKQMVFAQYDSEPERDAEWYDALIACKVEPFTESDCAILVESEAEVAEIVADLSGKPVLCVADGKIYY